MLFVMFITTPRIADGAARSGTSLFQELRNTIFSHVSQRAIRKIACQTFLHLHNMDLSFHLARQTGGMARAIDRGTRYVLFCTFTFYN